MYILIYRERVNKNFFTSKVNDSKSFEQKIVGCFPLLVGMCMPIKFVLLFIDFKNKNFSWDGWAMPLFTNKIKYYLSKYTKKLNCLAIFKAHTG